MWGIRAVFPYMAFVKTLKYFTESVVPIFNYFRRNVLWVYLNEPGAGAVLPCMALKNLLLKYVANLQIILKKMLLK